MKPTQAIENRKKRTWTPQEDIKLIDALLDLTNSGIYKAENEFKRGWSLKLEEVLRQQCPASNIQAKPHIESRYKVLGREFAVVYDMLAGTSTSGFVIDPNTGMLVASDDVWETYLKTQIQTSPKRKLQQLFHSFVGESKTLIFLHGEEEKASGDLRRSEERRRIGTSEAQEDSFRV